MVSVGDVVLLLGALRDITGGKGLVVSADGCDAKRVLEADLVAKANLALKDATNAFTGTNSFAACPTAGAAATDPTQLVRKNEVDAGISGLLSAAFSLFQPIDADLLAIAALSTTTFGRSLLTQASATTLRETLLVPRSIWFHATCGSNVTLTSLPEAERFINGSQPQAVRGGDLTGCSQVRLWVYVATASAAGPDPRLLVGWYDSFSATHSNYVDLGDGVEVECSLAATGLINSGWVSIDRTACIDPCFVALKSAGGDGSGSPAFRAAWLEYR